MSSYYFLTSLFPPLKVGQPVDLSMRELSPLLKSNLSSSGMKSVEKIRRYHDLENLRYYWIGEPLVPYGNLSAPELEEAIVSYSGLPEYVYTFMEQFESVPDRLRHFPKLITQYYQTGIEKWTGFLKSYLEFERDLRLIGLGFRAKKLGRDLSLELQYEDPSDPVVAQLLAQKDSSTFEHPYRYEELKEIFEEKGDNPIALHQALCEYKFMKYEGFLEGEIFSIDRVLAYIAQLVVAEEWLDLNKKKGIEVIDSIVKGIA